MENCIWCKKLNNGGSLEHILPEALGCPPKFVFNDGTVCMKCNNGLGHVDQAVIDEFDIFTFEQGIKRKKNNKPSIKSRGNFIAGYENDEKFYVLNMEKHSIVDKFGNTVAPYRGKERDINGRIDVSNGTGKVTFDISLSDRKKFRRGIVKIALSTLAYFLGTELALNRQFDPIRSFVNEGKGERPILWYASEDLKFRNHVWPPYVRDGNYSVTLRIAVYEFVVDLSPDLRFFNELRDKANEIYLPGRVGCLPANV